jgi:CRISPR/Cas system-associated exonuclease Cas4 (RecB family)
MVVFMTDSKKTTAQVIDDFCASTNNEKRPHLGCSLIGSKCDRFIWYSFRWALSDIKDGRIVRLLSRGNREEQSVISLLKSIGCDFSEKTNYLNFGCHIGGSVDGIILRGLPEDDESHFVLEIKTHNKKSFDTLIKDGVRLSKFQHFIQMQLYMLGTNIDKSLYYAVCKDDDRIYTEIVLFEEELAKKYLERAQKIALSDFPPEKISNDPSWYECKMCPAYDICQKKSWTKQINCRTCAHSTAKNDSSFLCESYNFVLHPSHQKRACDQHVLHPEMVPWERKESNDSQSATYVINGQEFVNGKGGLYTSEILKIAEAKVQIPDLVFEVKKNSDDSAQQ